MPMVRRCKAEGCRALSRETSTLLYYTQGHGSSIHTRETEILTDKIQHTSKEPRR